MTPNDFVARVVSAAQKVWSADCFCHHGGFRKLLSFNFEDYGTGPMALIDSEIIGHHIVRKYFTCVGDVRRSSNGDIFQEYACPKCGAVCEEEYAEYSISMYRSYFRFLDGESPAPLGLFLVGVRAISQSDYLKVHDFRVAKSAEEFLVSIGSVS
jgi:hypothetical protein